MAMNKDYEQARAMLQEYWDMAYEAGDEDAMHNIQLVMDLYESGFEQLANEQAKLTVLNYRGAVFDGDQMGMPADDMEMWHDD
jgi:hypothetical protein